MSCAKFTKCINYKNSSFPNDSAPGWLRHTMNKGSVRRVFLHQSCTEGFHSFIPFNFGRTNREPCDFGTFQLPFVNSWIRVMNNYLRLHNVAITDRIMPPKKYQIVNNLIIFFWHWAMKCEGDWRNWKRDWLVLSKIKFVFAWFCCSNVFDVLNIRNKQAGKASTQTNKRNQRNKKREEPHHLIISNIHSHV